MVAATLVLAGGAARADDKAGNASLAGEYLKVGITTGGTFARERGGAAFTLGGVLTYVHLDDNDRWLGGRIQLLGDSNGAAAVGPRAVLGVEAGKAFFGGSLSYVGEYVSGGFEHGAALHGKLTIGFVSLYAGPIVIVTGDDHFGIDVGIEIKPIFFARQDNGWQPI